MCFCTIVRAQVLITSDGFSYDQNFDGLLVPVSENAWANGVTLPGWYAAGEDEVEEDPDIPGVPTFFTTYYRNSGGSSSGRLYSYGSDGEADRALGAVNQDGFYGEIAYGARFQNNSNVELHSVTIAMRAEQWRSPDNDNYKSHQRIKVSYAVGNPIAVGAAWMLDDTQFTEIPEAYLITKDTTTMDASAALDGNSPDNYYTISASFPVSIPAGQQFFLRFLDENASGKDAAFGVDDLEVTFTSDNTATRISGSSEYNVFAYIDMGINEDIPDVGDGHAFLVPSPADLTAWEQILTNFFLGNWALVDGPAQTYGYVLTQYTQSGSSKSYYILRKTNSSPNFWGTFIKAVSPTNHKLVLESPHPVDDDYTGRQSAAVFFLADAANLFIAGTGRCLGPSTDPSPCTGGTATCRLDEIDEPYRKSDVAHATQNIFHLATTVLAGLNASTVFVQLHGFSQKASQPKDFYISCGSMDGFQKSVPDYPVMIREQFKTFAPEWDLQVTHADNDEKLGARDNTQGRFLNLYMPFLGYCENDIDPITVTNRFLHIEQYRAFRRAPTYYPMLAEALGNVINDGEYARQVRITDIDEVNDYVQAFDELPPPYPGGTVHQWGNNLHLPGWYAVRSVAGLFSNYTINDGSASTGGLYSYGNENTDEDRALGSLNTAATGRIAYGVLFRNNTGATIYGLDLTYDAEQWRSVNGQTQNVSLSYVIGAAIDLSSNGILNDPLFTSVPAGNMVSTNDVGNGAIDGNVIRTTISNLSIPVVFENGQELFIRFLDEDVGGAGTNDVALAIDNLTIEFSATAMPVTWRYFEVGRLKNKALLKWGADSESECDRYDIQRSVDGKLFETIATLDCQMRLGTNDYELSDAPPKFSPLVYYRICQYDFDGTTTCSQVRAFKQKVTTVPEVSYHNGALLIHSAQDEKPNYITVMDVMGRTLAEGIPVSESNADVSLRCSLPVNQLVFVNVNFRDHSYTARIRTGQ